MMTCDRTITDYAQRLQVLGRRADARLADALRRPTGLRTRLMRRVHRSLARRTHRIRRWQDGAFVALALPRAA